MLDTLRHVKQEINGKLHKDRSRNNLTKATAQN